MTEAKIDFLLILLDEIFQMNENKKEYRKKELVKVIAEIFT